MAKLKYPIGVQSFPEVRERGYLYVDKTGYLRRLLSGGAKYVFLSRPRRFGKSLFLSMAEEFFLGRRRLFEGLDINDCEYDWKAYPVLRLDLTGVAYVSPDAVIKRLNASMDNWDRLYGVHSVATNEVGIRFESLIKTLHEKYGERVVVLVDEYDKPLLETVDDSGLQEKYRSDLRSFYSNLKSQDAHIRFAMLTGVTKFGHLSIFSDLNNLQDISLEKEFSGICGITERELREYFNSGVEYLASESDCSLEEAYSELKKNYDGYHFSPRWNADVYNPFSILCALKSGFISDYWFQTGTPTFLVKMIRDKGIAAQSLEGIEVDLSSITSVSFDYRKSLYSVLYQSGYLTIKGYDRELGRVRLGFPNREVEKGFFQQLVMVYAPASADGSPFSVLKFYDDVMAGNAEEFMRRLQGLFADFSQDGLNRIPLEQHYQDVTFIVMKLMGFYTHVEYKTASGRIDLVVKTPRCLYVFEFKMDRTAEEAMAQIDSKGYMLPFSADGRRLIKIGANFSSKTRTLDSWLIEEN